MTQPSAILAAIVRTLRSPAGLAIALLALAAEVGFLAAGHPKTIAERLVDLALHRGRYVFYFDGVDWESVEYQRRSDGWFRIRRGGQYEEVGPVARSLQARSGADDVDVLLGRFDWPTETYGVWSRVLDRHDYRCVVVPSQPAEWCREELDAIRKDFAAYNAAVHPNEFARLNGLSARTEWKLRPLGVLNDCAMIALLIWAPLAAWHQACRWRARRRLNDQLCPNCRYDLSGTPGQGVTRTCPECGKISNA